MHEAYDAINRDDVEAFVALCRPDVEFNSLIAEVESPRYVGHDGIRRWWDDVVRAMGGLQFEIVKLEEIDDETLLLRNRVTGPTGVVQHTWQAVRLREGLGAWWGLYRTEAEARAAI
jgi:ketosteroid isomerase-like protein